MPAKLLTPRTVETAKPRVNAAGKLERVEIPDAGLPVCIWSFNGPVRVPGRCDIAGPVARLPSSPWVALEPAVSTLLRPAMLQRLRGCASTAVMIQNRSSSPLSSPTAMVTRLRRLSHRSWNCTLAGKTARPLSGPRSVSSNAVCCQHGAADRCTTSGAAT